jgi:hypothetical protein
MTLSGYNCKTNCKNFFLFFQVDGLIEETDRIKRERDFFKWKYEQLLLEKDKGNKVRSFIAFLNTKQASFFKYLWSCVQILLEKDKGNKVGLFVTTNKIILRCKTSQLFGLFLDFFWAPNSAKDLKP